MNCPICGTPKLKRDSIDNGIGVQYGPYGCPCGWSEDEKYDIRNGPKFTTCNYRLDQWGGATPPC
jgi:hypothetical protein